MTIAALLAASATAATPTLIGWARADDSGAKTPRPAHPAPVAISAFDCEKVVDLPGVAAPAGPIPASRGVRAWQGGGPSGANWNVDDLRCVVDVASGCTTGKISVAIRVGQEVVAEREATIERSPLEIVLAVPEKKWRHNLDRPARKGGVSLPFKTAVFRASAVADCAAPEPVSLKTSAYRVAVADDTFVAGFAWGE